MNSLYVSFEYVSAVIDAYPPCIVLCAACLSFEVDHLFSTQSVLWAKRVTAFSMFLTLSENSFHALVKT